MGNTSQRVAGIALMIDTEYAEDHCTGCVYYPPNLPADAYSEQDYRMLQRRSCSFEHLPGDSNCVLTRKTSCSLVDLENLKRSV